MDNMNEETTETTETTEIKEEKLPSALINDKYAITLLEDVKARQISIVKEVQRTRKAIIDEIVPITNKLRDVLLLGLALIAVGGAFYSLSKEKQNEYAEKFLTTTLTGGGIIAVGVKLYEDSRERSASNRRIDRSSVYDDDANEELETK